MDGGGYLRLLRRRWRLVLLGVLLGFLSASVLTLLSTPQYESSSEAFVSVRDTGDTVTADANQIVNANQASQFAIERVKSYVNIVNSSAVTSQVVAALRLPMTPAQLAKRITVSAPQDTVLIDITVRDPSPGRAQRIAAAVDRAFAQTVAGLESSPGLVSPVTITFVRQPTVATAPASPRPVLNLALGLLAGIMLGLGAAIARDSLDSSVRTTAELEALAGSLPLGSVPNDPGCRAAPLMGPGNSHSPRTESYERLRTNLHFVPVPPRSLVVTSAVDGEGRTVTAANIALALARVGVQVALVEADLRRPRLAGYLGLPDGPGLSEVLTGRAVLDDALHRWGDDELPLWVLASGALPANPNELLCSAAMVDVLTAVGDRVDVVLIDTPALLATSDAAILAKLTDGAVVVVRAGRTTREQVTTALASLATLDAQVYGTVLNRVPRRWLPVLRRSRPLALRRGDQSRRRPVPVSWPAPTGSAATRSGTPGATAPAEPPPSPANRGPEPARKGEPEAAAGTAAPADPAGPAGPGQQDGEAAQVTGTADRGSAPEAVAAPDASGGTETTAPSDGAEAVGRDDGSEATTPDAGSEPAADPAGGPDGGNEDGNGRDPAGPDPREGSSSVLAQH